MIPLHDTIPRKTSPFVMWLIIALNLFFFCIELLLPQPLLARFIYFFGVVPARYTHPDWFLHGVSYWPFLTCMFLHGGWLHFIGNMWTLWIFGDNVEDRMGHIRFAIFYILCGIIASVVHVTFNPHSMVPTIGASGAIAGVMGAYFTMFPYSRIITIVPIFFFPWIVELPAVIFLGAWFFMQFFSGTFSLLTPGAAGGIAWWAHIGGFIAGMVLCPIFKQSRKKYYMDEWHPIRYISRP